MKHALMAALAGVSLLAAGGAQAAGADDLLKKNACTACHAIDKKGVGPSYKDVANKYRGQSDAPAKLAEKVKKGGTGVWGQIPMPPNAGVNDADLKTMITYILSLK
jgi:cytochrome c